MHEDIELAIDSPDGIIDCRLEPQMNAADELFFNATILFPNMVNGINRSEIFCYDLVADNAGNFFFEDPGNEMHPKIKKLERQISAAISDALK